MTRTNSIIKIKCKCSPECEKVPTMSCYGYFYEHLPEDLKEKAGTRQKVAKKNRNKRIAIGRNLRNYQKSTQEDAVYLTLWFQYQMTVSKKVCENCGVSLAHYNEKEWYNSQHHIIEKSLCHSVASHPQNHIVLGFWCCHSQNHTSWLNMSKMPCYEEMKKRFNMFKNDIAANELSKLHKHPFLTT